MQRRPSSIAVILHDFALGGTERIALRLAAAWAERGVRVAIFAGSSAGELRPLAGAAVEIVVADPPIARGPGSRRRLGRFAAAAIAAREIDGCFVPGNYHWPAIAALARIAPPRRPAIVAQVSSALDKPQRGRLRQAAFDWRMRRLLAPADAVVTMSDGDRAAADRILRAPGATTIPSPILADDVPPPSPAVAAPVLLAAGRLVPAKGFATLIDAFALLGDPAARLAILGAGRRQRALRGRIARRGLGEAVTLPGYAADIRPWLDDARLFVLSSRYEGYPAVLVEALAAGRPVVATRCTPAADALLSGGAGWTVPVGDAPALAQAMRAALAAAPPDPARLAALVGQHRIGPVADAYLDLFATLSGRHLAA